MKRLSLINSHLLSSRPEICIVLAKRSPVLRAGSSFSKLSAAELGGATLNSMLTNSPIDRLQIQELYLGCVYSANLGQNPAKQVAVLGGLHDNVSCQTVNKLCASGMKALTLGCLSLLNGNADCVLVGGVESMSNYPYLLHLRNQVQNKVKDSLGCDVLLDAVTKESAVNIADYISHEFSFSKEILDEYAELSCKRTEAAQKAGKFVNEIVSIQHQKLKAGVKTDEYKKENTVRKNRVISKNGTTSAGNACGLNDGASFIVLATKAKAMKEGWPIMCTVESFADAEQESKKFPISPSLAIKKTLERAGVNINQIDFMELNEPFSNVVLANSKLLSYDINKININGGALSMGHPVGSSGCRILVTLAHILQSESCTYGIGGICNGAGGATSVLLKKFLPN